MTIKLKNLTLSVLALAFSAVLPGCATRITDFTLLSTKNIDLAKASGFKRAPNRVSAEDKAFIIIFIPTGVPHVKEAVDRALQSVPGAVALVDGVVKNKGWWFIFGETGIVVEGTPLIDPSLASQPLPSNRMVSYYDADAKRYVVKYVNDATYAKVARSARDGHSKGLDRLLLSQTP